MASRSGFTPDEARAAGERIGIDWRSAPFDLEQFRMGMDVELEQRAVQVFSPTTASRSRRARAVSPARNR